jgi:hypothetical protein
MKPQKSSSTVLGQSAPPARPTVFGAFLVAMLVTAPFAVLAVIFEVFVI